MFIHFFCMDTQIFPEIFVEDYCFLNNLPCWIVESQFTIYVLVYFLDSLLFYLYIQSMLILEYLDTITLLNLKNLSEEYLYFFLQNVFQDIEFWVESLCLFPLAIFKFFFTFIFNQFHIPMCSFLRIDFLGEV